MLESHCFKLYLKLGHVNTTCQLSNVIKSLLEEKKERKKEKVNPIILIFFGTSMVAMEFIHHALHVWVISKDIDSFGICGKYV